MESATKYDDVNTPAIFAIGFLAVVVLIAFVLFLQVIYYRAESQLHWRRTSISRSSN